MRVNFISFYIAWWGIVYFEKMHQIWGVFFIGLVHLCLHFYLNAKDKKNFLQEIRTLLVVSALGLLADCILNYVNVFKLNERAIYWLPVIWLIFSTTVNHSLQPILNLDNKKLFFLGAIFGPLSYVGAARFGLLVYSLNFYPVILHACFWGLFLILIKRLRSRYEVD